MNIDKYLYEIIDDYKNANSEEENSEIFEDFCSSIWSCSNKRRVYTKTIRFKVRNDLLDLDIGQIFNAWSEIDYIGYKAMTKNTDWCSLIRQKINNLYTRYFDKEVILNKEYMDLLKTPYNLYYRWIKGYEFNVDELTETIENAIYKAEELKSMYQKQKLDLSWSDYKKLIEGYLQKIFNRCELIEDYETKSLTYKYIYELASEDNSYVSYICRSLEGEMLNYQKERYKLKRGRNKEYKRCIECGSLIENTGNKKMYCSECAKIIRAKKRVKYNSDYYNKHIKNK